MAEIWKDITGFEGLYQVSDLGQVRSLKFGKTRIMKPQDNGQGYLQVQLCRNGETKKFKVHRLVANAFLPNPLNLPVINHKDENPSNNVVSNLEFCTQQYNVRYGTGLKRMAAKLVNGPLAKQVLQYDKQGHFLKQWPSTIEVERTLGFYQGNICRCCNGERKTAHGFVWKYED